jgi:tRNA-dihydrouridine synthase 3
MGLATSFLQGSREEWSLVRRHPSERTFGIQLAGNKPSLLTTTAEVIAKECGDNIDFVDLNCGCPIDMVFNNGSGSACECSDRYVESMHLCEILSAVMNSAGKLGKIIIGMSKALGSIPLTVKLRTGVKDGYNTAHKLMPRLAHEWGVGALAVRRLHPYPDMYLMEVC